MFELIRKGNNWKEKVLYSFCSEDNCTDGATPNVPLIIDTAGDLYGIAVERGTHNFGNIFELIPNARRTKWTLRVLHGFCEIQNPHCGDGTFALGGLSYSGMSSGVPYDGVSPLYGTAAYDGAHSGGVVYQLTHTQNSWTQTPIYNFCASVGCSDGSSPVTSVFVDSFSNIFGTASAGGSNGGGVVFELARLGSHKGYWTEKVLYNFCSLADCADGSYPSSQPLIDGNGNMFGTTTYGGAAAQQCINGYDCGVLFELAADGTETTLHAFCSLENCADGVGPEGSLISDASGNLYGATLGIDGPRTLFRFSGNLEVLHSFCSKDNCTDGYEPYNVTLRADQAGNMFGTARSGGVYGGGVEFEWLP